MENENKGKKLYWLLTILVILIPIPCIRYISAQTLLQYSDIYSTVVAFLAFIWFYRSLYLQRIQLNEQREQFNKEFQKIKNAERRENISLAKEILKEAEEEAKIQLKELDLGIDERHLMNLLIEALKISKNIFENENEYIVCSESLKFFKYLSPINTILFGIMQAGKNILENEQEKSIPDMTPEKFVVQYRDKLNSYPFFSKHLKNTILLDDFILNIRIDVIKLATLTAQYIQNPTMFHKDKIDLLLERVKKQKYALPKITQKYLEITQTASNNKNSCTFYTSNSPKL